MSDTIDREKELLSEALELPSPEARAAFLRGACGKDEPLRERVESLLIAYEAAAGFIPTKDLPATVIGPILEGPGSVIGRYKLLQQIGEGGFGVVYMAEQKEPVKRRVALKIIKLGMDTKQIVARFEAERQALAMMDHPNIAKILDGGMTGVDEVQSSKLKVQSLTGAADGVSAGRPASSAEGSPIPPSALPAPPFSPGRPYFVMELVKGIAITRFCDENNLSTKERLELFTTVCQAIQHAHQKGIIHRDIKPSNILVTLHDGKPVPKVIDFGIAKATQQELTEKTIFTQFQQMIGTPAYMSPEQAEMSGLDIDTRTDIYSLGVLLYELLTGKTPLDAKVLLSGGYDEIRRRIKEEEPPRPSTRVSTMEGEELTSNAKHRNLDPKRFVAELRGDLDWIVMKALEKDRTRRYDNANNLAADIERHLNNEPILARPPSGAYRLQKLLRRNKLAFAAGSAVLLALLVGLGIATWQAVVATRAQRIAEAERIAANDARAGEARERSLAVAERDRAQAEAARADREKTVAERNAYAATMTAVQSDWDSANISHLRELLEETSAYPEKGFEWYYWQRMIHSELLCMREHDAPVTSVCYSPDGSRIASGCADQTVRLWDAANGQMLLTVRGHSGEVSSVAFSSDGRRLVTAAQDGTIRLWDANSGQELHLFPGRAAILSPDGTALLIARMDGRVVLVDVSSGRELAELDEPEHPTKTLIRSPAGDRFLSVAWDGALRMWSWDRNSPPAPLWLQEPLSLDGARKARPAAFSPDGQRLVIGGRDRIVRVLDAGTGRELRALAGQPEEVEVVAFAADGLLVASAGPDRLIRMWDLQKGELLFNLKGHEERVLSLAFSPDGRRLASASTDGTVRVWDGSRAAFPLVARVGASSGASNASVPPIAGFEAHMILSTTAPTPGLVVVRFSPDGRRLLTAGKDHFARLWDAASLTEIRAMRGGTSVVSHANFSQDGKFITTGNHDGSLRLWDTESGEQLRVWKQAWAKVLWSKMTKDGKRILSNMGDGGIRIWEVATGAKLLEWQAHETYAATAEYSLDEQRIASCGRDGLVKIWEASTGNELMTFRGHEGLVIPLAYSADGKKLVTGGIADRTVRIWDAADGRELRSMRAHLDSIWDVNFSQYGSRLVSASVDGTVRIWDVANGRGLLTLRGHIDRYMAAIFSPDETRLACAGNSPAFEIWETASADQVIRWRDDHLNSLKRRAAWEKRAKDRSNSAQSHRIKSWLILMGVPLEGTKSPIQQLRSEQLLNEAGLRPRPDETVRTRKGDLTWKKAQFDNGIIDFDHVAGTDINHSLAGYVVCYVRSDKARQGLRLKIGTSDQARVYLNGKPLYEYPFGGYLTGEVDTVAGVDLLEGLNIVVLKMIGTFSVMQATLRFVDDEDNTIQGLEFITSPD